MASPSFSRIRCPPSKVNPPMSDWIVWRVIEPDSFLLHKGKDKLPMSPGAGGSQDRVLLSELLTTYKSLPQFSMQELGQREWENWLGLEQCRTTLKSSHLAPKQDLLCYPCGENRVPCPERRQRQMPTDSSKGQFVSLAFANCFYR